MMIFRIRSKNQAKKKYKKKFHFLKTNKICKQIKNNIIKPIQNFFNKILIKKIGLQALLDCEIIIV